MYIDGLDSKKTYSVISIRLKCSAISNTNNIEIFLSSAMAKITIKLQKFLQICTSGPKQGREVPHPLPQPVLP